MKNKTVSTKERFKVKKMRKNGALYREKYARIFLKEKNIIKCK